MGSDFTRWFEYDHWANHEIQLALKGLKTPLPKAHKTLCHIYAAQEVWHARLRSVPAEVPVWPVWTMAECDRWATDVRQKWHKYFANFTPALVAHSVTYKNSKGEQFHNKVVEILQHVLLHSSHHRGQITLELRAAGHTPPNVDYIHHVRHALPK